MSQERLMKCTLGNSYNHRCVKMDGVGETVKGQVNGGHSRNDSTNSSCCGFSS